MSLITQCPACSTMFKVVPDQLRISEGWVRCGQCDEVFDANAHLRSLDEPQVAASEPVAPNATVVEPLPAPIAEQVIVNEANAVYDWGPLLEPRAAQESTSPVMSSSAVTHEIPGYAQEPSWDPLPLQDAQPAPAHDQQKDGFLDRSPQDLHTSDETNGSHSSPAAVDDWVHQPLAPQELGAASAADAGEDSAPSFMPRGTSRGEVNRYLGRKLMLSFFSLLVVLLASQWLFMERNRVAATIPALRPLLESGCAVLACSLSAPRQIESIAIDSSAFTHVKSGVYNLNLSLRNGAAIELAAPALELTLTDIQDQALIRRVLLPGEYSVKTSIGAGADLVANVPIAVKANVASEKISGYKLLAFYP